MNIVKVLWWIVLIVFCMTIFCVYRNNLKKERIKFQEELRKRQKNVKEQFNEKHEPVLTEREKKIKEAHDEVSELKFEIIKFERRVMAARRIVENYEEKLKLAYKNNLSQTEIKHLKEKIEDAHTVEAEQKNKLEELEKEYKIKLQHYEALKK